LRQGSRPFSEWFEEATQFAPYRYQVELAERDAPPSVLDVPTGSGKTQAVLGAWLYQRLELDAGPRRLVYALPMRTLVEQTWQVAREMRERIGLDAAELPIHVLMGGEGSHESDWRLKPEASQVIIGTIDMLLSRALNRGYGESRFAWPVSFGLLNADCRWVFDEVQLMGPARATSAQLDGLRTALGTALPCETVWVSATVDPEALETIDRPSLGGALSLPDADANGPLRKRLTAAKTLSRADLSDLPPKDMAKAIAQLAIDSHKPRTRTLVVLNRVESAQKAFAELARLTASENSPTTVLLHSRFRPPDREAHVNEALAPPGEEGTIVVSTQVIEAGVDFSSRTLLTETAPFSSVVQRLGRCNRAGEHEQGANAIWLDRGEPGDKAAAGRAAAPYLPADLSHSRAALLKLEGKSVSPQVLAQVHVHETPADPVVLRRRDLIDLFDTSPDLSGMDVDIAPFIREDDERSVLVCFREIGEDDMPLEQGLPDRSEVVEVPLGTSLAKRRCWKADYVNRNWRWERRSGGELSPGSTVILDAAQGGYTNELGWDGKSKRVVEIIDAPEHPGPETFEDNSQGNARQELLDHLHEVRAEAERIAAELDLGAWSEALSAAGALHDVGKAHPAFQAMLRSAMDLDADVNGDGKLWAKSGTGGGEQKRRFLRHELVSALALRSMDGAISLPHPDLTTYLIAAHHGKVRLSIRPAPGENQPEAEKNGARFALGVIDGDSFPAVETPLGTLPQTNLSLECMELGAEDSWTNGALALRDSSELGPFRLAFLEAVLRIADWRASA
jgi:CRISPR-associated endonuclease/helicase Cas3